MLAADAGSAVAGQVSATAETVAAESTSADAFQANDLPARADVGEIVFVDQSLAGLDGLLEGVSDGAEIVLLDSDHALLNQIARGLKSRVDVKAVHVVTHGREGQLVVGRQQLGVKTLESSTQAVSAIRAALAADADLLFYGCDVAAGQRGRQFVAAWARLTGADVAASTDRTGDLRQGGDWVLERRSGAIETQLVFSPEAREGFSSTLNVTVTASGQTGEEIAQLLIDDEVVAEWNVGTESQTFTHETEASLAPEPNQGSFHKRSVPSSRTVRSKPIRRSNRDRW